MERFYTAESVTEGHPDKLCDQIADSVLDDCLAHDPLSRVACEVLATRSHIVVAGEITSHHVPHVPAIIESLMHDIGYSTRGLTIDLLFHRQSPDIAAGVDNPLEEREVIGTGELGAGDQGVMVGYACNETPEMLPLPVVLANRLALTLSSVRKAGIIPGLRPDGKTQVTMEYDEDGKPLRLDTVVISAQHSPAIEQDELLWQLTDKVLAPALHDFPPDEDTKILVNPSGRFVFGGPEADTGLTGRKLMVDSYGVFAPHGGGAFSGKDPTKVDRSGAYMARYIAKNIVAAGLASRCKVTLAYAIGKAEPVMVSVDTFGTGTLCADDCLEEAVKLVFGLTPASIIRQLDLLKPIYARTAVYGHFAAPSGTQILAAASGTVTIANGIDSWGGGYGYHIKIDHSNGLETLYAHCSAICVTPGQQVQQGEVIGFVGSTGNSTGSHLHFEVWVNGKRTDTKAFFMPSCMCEIVR